jgi:signal transduction histidine kinase
MREAVRVARGLAFSWRGDALLAGIMVAWAAVNLRGAQWEHEWLALLGFLLPYACALTARRKWPVAAAAVAGAALAVMGLVGPRDVVADALSIPFSWTPFLLAYSLGADAATWPGLAGVALMTAGLQLQGDPFNPIFEMITLGPWLVGRVSASRRAVTEQLVARNAELLAEQELFARESVRVERTRIARELHDIVAHCLSVMVVQAGAGQRVPQADRDGMARALASVALAACEAQEEIGRLVELLGGDLPDGSSPDLAMAGELVRRAASTGLQVSCRFAGSCDELTPAASQAAYRVVQEALTNALKHAPGAPVSVTIEAAGQEVSVSVVNSAPREPQELPSALADSGGQFGLAAMRERVAACGGVLTAGPSQAGGWQVRALLPARIALDPAGGLLSWRYSPVPAPESP